MVTCDMVLDPDRAVMVVDQRPYQIQAEAFSTRMFSRLEPVEGLRLNIVRHAGARVLYHNLIIFVDSLFDGAQRNINFHGALRVLDGVADQVHEYLFKQVVGHDAAAAHACIINDHIPSWNTLVLFFHVHEICRGRP